MINDPLTSVFQLIVATAHGSSVKTWLVSNDPISFLLIICVGFHLQTEAMKDMEAKLEEQEQNRLYLDQLLSMLKDRDPGLLHLMNSSLASR